MTKRPYFKFIYYFYRVQAILFYKSMNRYLTLLPVLGLVCCIMGQSAKAQIHRKWEGAGIEANFMTAEMIKHTPKILVLPERAGAFELNIVQQTYGKKDWHQRRNYPKVGFGLTYTDYGIDSVYGKCLGLVPALEIPVVRFKKLEWTIRLGFGIGYVTRRYVRYPDWDTLNTVIGSHLNNYSQFVTDIRYHINKHLDIQAGANFSHISNAAFRRPNLGINLYGAHIGLRYFPVSSSPEKIKRNLPPLKSRWLIQGRLGFSANELGPPDGPLYPVYLASVYASKRYMSKNKAIAGIDYSYHNNIYAMLKAIEQYPGDERSHAWSGSIFAGNEFLYGRFGILLQIGVYFKRSELALDPYYQKLGANFYLVQRETGMLKELCISGLLKTHKAEAELVEMGLGVGF